MGKTYKKFPWGNYRKPRGRKQAVVAGARNKAVPPSAWDDIRADDQCYLPSKIARRNKKSGKTREETVTKLRKKFRLSYKEAMEVTYQWDSKSEVDYAIEVFDRLSHDDKIVVMLRYDSILSWYREVFFVDGCE